MTRPYVQRARADAARQTRQAILEAARTAVLAEGTPDVSVGAIADAAGVARSTIYATFGSRAGLLAALSDDTLERAGLAAVIAEFLQPDPRQALERSLLASCRMYAAEHPVIRRLIVLGQLDPEVAGPLARSEGDRRGGVRMLAARLAEAGELRPGLDPESAARTLTVLTGFWAYDELASGLGLDPEAAAGVLLETARAAVLADQVAEAQADRPDVSPRPPAAGAPRSPRTGSRGTTPRAG